MTLAETYARALHEAGEAPKAPARHVLFAHFIAVLQRRGHEKLLPRIEKEYMKLLARAERNTVRVRVAHKKDEAAAKKAAAEFSVPGTHAPHVIVDESLVSGYVISGPDFRYDASGKRALLELYKELTATN